MELFKLDDKTFAANFINIQYTFESKSFYPDIGQIGRETCDLTIEMPYNKRDYNFLLNKYSNVNYKSTITNSKIISQGCLLRNINKDFNTITIDFMCDYIKSNDDLSNRRDEILEIILDKTSK